MSPEAEAQERQRIIVALDTLIALIGAGENASLPIDFSHMNSHTGRGTVTNAGVRRGTNNPRLRSDEG